MPREPLEPTIQPWQFGLRTLLVLMASASVLLLVMGMIGLLWSITLLWFLLLGLAHVVGNSWGTRLREGKAADPPPEFRSANPVPQAADPAAIRLRHRAVFGFYDYAVIAAVAALGGGLGGSALWAAYWNRTGYSAIVVGAVSSAVIGGFFGFLCVTFARVALAAVNDARRSSQPDCFAPHSANLLPKPLGHRTAAATTSTAASNARVGEHC